MTKNETERTLTDLIPARLMKMLRQKGTVYFGPCVVNAPGAWTRCGPTWKLTSGVFLVVGPGVRNWNTSKGLAQLAVDPSVAPTLHEEGATLVPDPAIMIAVTDAALRGPNATRVCALTEAVSEAGLGK